MSDRYRHLSIFHFLLFTGATSAMHIGEGIVTAPVLAVGTVVAAVGLAAGLKKLRPENIPRVAVLSSAFFVGSLVHVPVGIASAHLVLNGINGLLLGWAAFPSIFVALTFQALLFQFGGITVLGLNTLIMALPAVVVWIVFGRFVAGRSKNLALAAGFLAGFIAVGLSAVTLAAFLSLSGEQFREAAVVALGWHVPIMLTEGIISALCIGFLRQVKPEMLGVKALSNGEGFSRPGKG
jgi:cobalt/nickel transport system permease protein